MTSLSPTSCVKLSVAISAAIPVALNHVSFSSSHHPQCGNLDYYSLPKGSNFLTHFYCCCILPMTLFVCAYIIYSTTLFLCGGIYSLFLEYH